MADKKTVNVKVVGQDGRTFIIKIKRHVPLEKLMDMYCERAGLCHSMVRFIFDGKRIQKADTPFGLGMDDEDEIDVFQEQISGSHNYS